jgi:hypothetical protein
MLAHSIRHAVAMAAGESMTRVPRTTENARREAGEENEQESEC